MELSGFGLFLLSLLPVLVLSLGMAHLTIFDIPRQSNFQEELTFFSLGCKGVALDTGLGYRSWCSIGREGCGDAGRAPLGS